MVLLPGPPTKTQVRSEAFKALRFMVQFNFDSDGGGTHTRWCEARISRLPTRTKRNHRITFLEDGSTYDFNPLKAEFNTAPDAPVQCWFAFGTADQMAEIMEADGEE
jgi:hypothetical protein